MKKIKLPLAILLTLTLSAGLLAGCTATADNSGVGDSSAAQTGADATSYAYSDGLDERGYYEGITALDYVEKFDYDAIKVPADSHEVSGEDVDSQIESLLSSYSTSEEVTDRAVKDGDTVNIDYVGSVDGVEFDGGSTGGSGTEVTIGVTTYIDDFLEQLIGHKPGDTFDVEVTFPEDYGQENLNGKDAVFVTTVNHIVETTEPEVTDDFVAENLSEDHGWKTVKEMEEDTKEELQKNKVQEYVRGYLVSDVTVSSVPEEMVQRQEDAMINYYEQSAASYSMEMEEFLSTYAGVSTLDELVEKNADTLKEGATYSLVVQAVAEDAGITVSDEDVAKYFANLGTEDYSQYEEEYGLPYLKMNVLSQMVLDRLTENAVLE